MVEVTEEYPNKHQCSVDKDEISVGSFAMVAYRITDNAPRNHHAPPTKQSTIQSTYQYTNQSTLIKDNIEIAD